MTVRWVRIVVALLLTLSVAGAHALDRDEAAERARQASGGRVLAVETGQRNGEEVFVVRVLTPSGEVRVVVIDARTGAVR